MRKCETIERLYLDFDGFFASVMQQAMPALRGRPVGVVPFDNAGDRTVIIACSKEAKARGCKNVMNVTEARAACPDIVFVAQRPDLFRRAHYTLLSEIYCEIPIDAVKSIDELTCRLDPADIRDPHALADRIKRRLARNVGPYITCSIGFAANRLLAKMACKIDKPNGVTVWPPEIMPGPLLDLDLQEISGVGARMERRLNAAGIFSMQQLLSTAPKQLRALWGNVYGERMWYALHGYDIQATPTSRGMYGHARVLPPDLRRIDQCRSVARLLLAKAARRLRRDGFYAKRLVLSLDMGGDTRTLSRELPCVNDDQAILSALGILWDEAAASLPRRHSIIRVGVTLLELTPADQRQLDMLRMDDAARQRWERITLTMDSLNQKFGERVLSLGPWTPPPGGYAGGKIAFTRIPAAEDF